MSDLIAYLKATADKIGDELDLKQVEPGDELHVATRTTQYRFKMIDDRNGIVTASRFDRPNAKVRIMGCTFGKSSSIKPDHLFCGGNLEFHYEMDGHEMTHRTTAIRSIQLRRRRIRKSEK